MIRIRKYRPNDLKLSKEAEPSKTSHYAFGFAVALFVFPEGSKQDIDFISGIIRQEFMAVYHIEDIKNVVEQQVNRIDKMLMKSGKLTASQFFLLIKVMQNLVGREDEAYFAELVERAGNM